MLIESDAPVQRPVDIVVQQRADVTTFEHHGCLGGVKAGGRHIVLFARAEERQRPARNDSLFPSTPHIPRIFVCHAPLWKGSGVPGNCETPLPC